MVLLRLGQLFAAIELVLHMIPGHLQGGAVRQVAGGRRNALGVSDLGRVCLDQSIALFLGQARPPPHVGLGTGSGILGHTQRIDHIAGTDGGSRCASASSAISRVL